MKGITQAPKDFTVLNEGRKGGAQDEELKRKTRAFWKASASRAVRNYQHAI